MHKAEASGGEEKSEEGEEGKVGVEAKAAVSEEEEGEKKKKVEVEVEVAASEEEELLSIRQALRRILPAAEADHMGATSFLAPSSPFGPADRVRVLVCLLPNITLLGMALHLPGWELGTTAAVIHHSPGPKSPRLVPVLCKVNIVYFGGRMSYADDEVWPREVLWAFSLPKVHFVFGYWVADTSASASTTAIMLPTRKKRGWGTPGASGVQLLHLTKDVLGEGEMEGLLRLPSALKGFFYRHHTPWYANSHDATFSVCGLARGLSTQAGSLEKVVVKGALYEKERVKSDRLGSMCGFTKMQELEVEFWMLAGPECSEIARWGGAGQRAEDKRVGLSGLPRGLTKLTLGVSLCFRCDGGVCRYAKRHLRKLFARKAEWAPRLKELELIASAMSWPASSKPNPDFVAIERGLRELAEEKGAKIEVRVLDGDLDENKY